MYIEYYVTQQKQMAGPVSFYNLNN